MTLTVQLRPDDQLPLVQTVQAHWRAGARGVLMRADTGFGKTVCLAYLVDQHSGASCIMAHRQELVLQLSITLARYGVRHDLIASDATIRAVARAHVEELGACYYQPGARCRVASVDTIIRRTDLAAWAQQVTLVVPDECFPAGTIVDGKPIESLRVGDIVTAFNEQTGGYEPRRVVRAFKNVAPKRMVLIALSEHHVIRCTAGHPFWTRRGWVDAIDLTINDEVLLYDRDLHHVSEACRPIGFPSKAIPGDWSSILQPGMLDSVSEQSQFGNDGAYKPAVCFRTNADEQFHVEAGRSGESIRHSPRPRNPAEATGRQWKDRAGGSDAGFALVGIGIRHANGCPDTNGARVGLPDVLQVGRGQFGSETGNRSGRGFAQQPGSSRAGSEERSVSSWAWLDRVEIYERSDPRYARYGADDGYVYNIEVEGLHTYVANGITVHNCHHVVRGNKWSKAIDQFTHPALRILLPTATPKRADGKGLGSHADGYADVMVEAPPMRWCIDRGYLTDYRIVCPPSDLQVLSEPGASGDWSPEQLREAARKSHIVGDVVEHYLKWASGRLGVTFCTDVETAVETTAAFRAAGVVAETLTGKTPDHVRRDILRRYRQRDVMQLVTVDIVSEGFDLPAIEVASMARPTQSLALYMQQFGRALRPMPGKDRALIIDHVSNVIRHGGPPDRPRVWSLDRRDSRRKSDPDAIPLRVCIECFQPYERFYRKCPHCGYYPEPAGRSSPEQVDGDLAELSAEALERLRGAVVDTDRSPQDYARDQATRTGLPQFVITTNAGRYERRVEAQLTLRAAMERWGGMQRAAGLTDEQMQRKFWLTYNIDVLSAQGLGATDALALTERIDGTVNRG